MVELFPLTLQAAKTTRRRKVLVGPVDLTITGGRTTVAIGPNGAGKTSLLRLMHGTARLSSGKIAWGCATDEARHHQAFVFQRPIMLRRSVEENLIYPLTLRGVPRREAKAAAKDWAERVGLGDFLQRQATVLSGGEQQKLAIARALIIEPALVFLDEPTASLDGRSVREIEAILQDAARAGTTLILSTHDMGQARRIADDVVFLLGGSVHEQGAANTFFEDPQTAEAKAFLKGDIVE